MKIESEAAKASRYGDDAIEAFNTAVDNGQARMAMTILVDIVNTFADKIDELESAAATVIKEEVKAQEVIEVKAEEVIEVKKEEPKQKTQAVKEDTKSLAKEQNLA